jgi:hypothetical protein
MVKISICIPLGKGSEWKDNELRLTLRSLEKHMKIPYDVFIFIDPRNPISWIKNVNVRKVRRTYPEQAKKHFGGVKHYENYFDVLHKIEAMVNDPDVSEQFVLFYDDTHLSRDINNVEDFAIYVATKNYNDMPEAYERRKGKWLKTVMAAIDIARKNGRPKWDYESHLPRFYSKSKWRELFKRFPIDEQLIPYSPSTLYINWYVDKPTVHLFREKNDVKAGFYGDRFSKDEGAFSSSSREKVKKAIEGKMFINYNDMGLTDILKDYLFNLYPEKSMYEY